MSTWAYESALVLIGAIAAPNELFATKLQQTLCEANSSGSAMYGVSQTRSTGLDPSSPTCVFSISSSHALCGRLPLSPAGAR